MAAGHGEWKQPTDAEIEEWEEQKKLKDRISSEMGQYLLKGYKMLDKTCSVCTTILLQTKKGENKCILCEEILHTLKPKQEPSSQPETPSTPPAKRQVELDHSPRLSSSDSSIRYAQNVVLAKLQSSADDLAHCTSIDMSVQLCHLIRDLAETLASLNKAAS